MHKDLTDHARKEVGRLFSEAVAGFVEGLADAGQSLALAREHLIDILPEAFDRTAEELDGGEG